MNASGRDDIAVSVRVPDIIRLDPDITVPLALIFAELVSNAVGHGFTGQGGAITVWMDGHGDDMLSLHVRDDGRGLAPVSGPGMATAWD